jgi:hypothetical protein
MIRLKVQFSRLTVWCSPEAVYHGCHKGRRITLLCNFAFSPLQPNSAGAIGHRLDLLKLGEEILQAPQTNPGVLPQIWAPRVAAMTALMVCIRFSASSKTMDCFPSNTSSVTSMQEIPYFS